MLNIDKEFRELIFAIKTFTQKMNEGEEIEEIEKARAKKRQGTRTDIVGVPLSKEQQGRTRDIVAKNIGMGSGRQYDKAKLIMKKVDKKTIEKLDLNEISINQAYKQIKYGKKLIAKDMTNIYFIQSATGGPIKIGKARCVESRLLELQTGSPFILKVIKVIENVSYKKERELHKKYENYRLHGEWFSEEVLKLKGGK